MQASKNPPRAVQSAPFPNRARPKYNRSTNGCLTCRQRRKRCDQQRPICAACQRNRLRCNWPERRQSLSPRTSPSSPRTASSPSSIPHAATTGAVIARIPPSMGLPKTCGTLLLTHWSMMLFDHYLANTSTILSTLSPQTGAFRTRVVEFAISDSLMLHTLMTVSGTHLNLNDTAALEVRQAIFLHYRSVLHGIKGEVSIVLSARPESCLRLALILLLICHAEAIAGSMKGEIFPHLAAARQIIMIYRRSALTTPEEDEPLLGLVLETYAYLALVSNITPYGTMECRTVPIDDFIAKLDHLPRYATYGNFFSCGHDIFEYIPQIAVLAKQCLDEVEMTGSCSVESKSTYTRLHHELENLGSCSAIKGVIEQDAIAAREVYRRSLLIFLETAIAGPVVDDTESRRIIQDHVDSIFPKSQEVRETNFGAIMMWPLMIVASCVTQEEQKNSIRRRGKRPHRGLTNQVTMAQKILDLLWTSDDERAFGPYGLYLVMQKHGINYGMA